MYKMNSTIKIALFVVFIIALSGIMWGIYIYNKTSDGLQDERPDYVLNAVELQKQFREDENLASGMYINKVIEVSGIIESVRQRENETVSIVLKTGNDISKVICTLATQESTKLPGPGNEITLRGECSGFLMDVLLNNCKVIRH